MIKVNPRHNGVYEINWEPVKNVNHGTVSYTVKVLEKKDSKIDSLVSIHLKCLFCIKITFTSLSIILSVIKYCLILILYFADFK